MAQQEKPTGVKFIAMAVKPPAYVDGPLKLICMTETGALWEYDGFRNLWMKINSGPNG